MKGNGSKKPTSAADAVFWRYAPALHAFLRRRAKRVEDAEDVVQEVFLRILRMENREFVRNPRAYLHGIALHVVREFRLRDTKAGALEVLEPRQLVELAEARQDGGEQPLQEQFQVRQQLERVLMRLPAAHRAVFLLHKRDGYSYEEIADRLKISVHAVDKYLMQAKVKIRTMDGDGL